MALKTRSKFYYGPEISANDIYIDFSEDNITEKIAVIQAGPKSPELLANEIQDALNAVGGQDYFVTIDRVTRLITISAQDDFTLKIATGSHFGTNFWAQIGFVSSIDLVNQNSYTGINPVGFEYLPQFFLLDYIPPTRNKDTIESTQNETATGIVEVVRFGVKSFVDLNIDFITNIKHDESSLIESNQFGVEAAEQFMSEIIKKGTVEFMEDRDKPDVFYTLRLESTQKNRSGLGFIIEEKIGEGLPEYFKTGILKFRVLEL